MDRGAVTGRRKRGLPWQWSGRRVRWCEDVLRAVVAAPVRVRDGHCIRWRFPVAVAVRVQETMTLPRRGARPASAC